MTLAEAVRVEAILQKAFNGRRAAVALLLTAVAIGLCGCGAAVSDPEAELREWLAAAESEAEEKNRAALMSRIADGYADVRGNRREDIDKILRYYLLRQKSVSLLPSIEEVRIFGESAAEILMTVGMAGSTGGLRLSADVWQFELELEKIGGDWMLIGARWAEFGEELR